MAEEPEEEESTEARFRRVQEELKAMELSDIPDEEVDARLREIQSRPIGELPQFDDPLAALEKRAQGARVTHNKAKGEEQSRLASDGKATRGLGIGLAGAYALIGLPLVGALVGYLLQRTLGGPWIPILVGLGFVGGIAFIVFLSSRENGAS